MGFSVIRTLGIAALAAVIGWGCGWYSYQTHYGGAAQFGPFSSDQQLSAEEVALANRVPTSGAPRIEVIGGEEFDFGVMEPGGEGTHQFVVRNVGTAPLELDIIGSTCKCTVGTLQQETVAPGEQTEIELRWVANTNSEEFGQTATLKTNDPSRGELNLKIRGKVISTMTMVPRRLTFGDVESGENIRLQSIVYSFSKTPIQPVLQSFSDPLLNDLANFTVEEVDLDELQDTSFASAQQAFRVNIAVRPGLPQGPLRADFKFGFVPRSAVDEQGRYESESLSEFHAEITGKIVGSITLVESRKMFLGEGGYIYTIGTVDPATASPERANILLRGPHRDSVKLSIGEVEPAGILHAELGEPVGRTSTVLVPLKLWVDSAAEPIDRMGRGGDDFGIVWIQSDHPEVSPLRLRVRFNVPKR